MIAPSLEAERAILGAVLVSPDLLPAVALGPTDFGVGRNRVLFAAMQRLDAARRPVDVVTLRDELERAREFEAVGGSAYLADLVRGVPRVGDVTAWEQVLRRNARARAVEIAGERMLAIVRAGDREAEDALEEGLRVLNDAAAVVGSTVDLDTAGQINTAVRNLEASQSETARGWTTGIPSLNARLGLLEPGRFVIVAARTGLGKSALLQNIGDAIAAQGGPALLFSAEMPVLELNRRRLVAEAGVPASHFERGGIQPTERDWDRIARAAGVLGKRPFYVEASTPTPLEARAKARFVKARAGLAVLLFDYLQLFPPGNGRKNETREAEVARVSRALKRMAMDLDVVVIAACQLNRNLEQRKDGRPRLSDLRESGSLEQDADIVVLLHRPDEDQDVTEAIVAKHRARGTGIARLQFRGDLYSFKELGDD